APAVDDQLPDPQEGERDERAQRAQPEDRDGVATVGLVHELEEGRDVPECLQPLRPGGWLAVGPGEQALRARADTVRDEAGRRGRHDLNFSKGRCVNITACKITSFGAVS